MYVLWCTCICNRNRCLCGGHTCTCTCVHAHVHVHVEVYSPNDILLNNRWSWHAFGSWRRSEYSTFSPSSLSVSIPVRFGVSVGIFWMFWVHIKGSCFTSTILNPCKRGVCVRTCTWKKCDSTLAYETVRKGYRRNNYRKVRKKHVKGEKGYIDTTAIP